jgi:hypothetical protein
MRSAQPDRGRERSVSSLASSTVPPFLMLTGRAEHTPPLRELPCVPSPSLLVPCDTQEEIDPHFTGLSDGGFRIVLLSTEPARCVRWDRERFGVSGDVLVTAVAPNERILIEWDGPPCRVERQFETRGDRPTLVKIAHCGSHGSDEATIAQAIDANGGFAILRAGLKAHVEHGVALNLIADHSPDGPLEPHG